MNSYLPFSIITGSATKLSPETPDSRNGSATNVKPERQTSTDSISSAAGDTKNVSQGSLGNGGFRPLGKYSG